MALVNMVPQNILLKRVPGQGGMLANRFTFWLIFFRKPVHNAIRYFQVILSLKRGIVFYIVSTNTISSLLLKDGFVVAVLQHRFCFVWKDSLVSRFYLSLSDSIIST